MKEYAQLLAQYIEEKTHKEITIDSGTKANNSIILQIVPQSTNLEGYQIDINSHQITISGNSEAGIFMAYKVYGKHCL